MSPASRVSRRVWLATLAAGVALSGCSAIAPPKEDARAGAPMGSAPNSRTEA